MRNLFKAGTNGRKSTVIILLGLLLAVNNFLLFHPGASPSASEDIPGKVASALSLRHPASEASTQGGGIGQIGKEKRTPGAGPTEKNGLSGSRSYVRGGGEFAETDELGGSWYRTSWEELENGSAENVIVKGNGTEADIVLSQNETNGSYVSPAIRLPAGMNWSVLGADKTLPVNTFLNVTVLVATDNATIPGFEELSEYNIDISNISTPAIRLKAALRGNGSATPTLRSWGVEWTAKNTWRDSFVTDKKTANSENMTFNGRAESQLRNDTAVLRSVNISLPKRRVWHTFRYNSSVPDNTSLSLSVHNANDHEILLRIEADNNATEGHFDLKGVNALGNTSVYLQATFGTNDTTTPVLYDWGINWSNVAPPVLKVPIDDATAVEDVHPTEVADLPEHFHDPYLEVRPPTYSLAYVSDPTNVTLKIENGSLILTNSTDNWTGSVAAAVNCTNVYGLSVLSNVFDITITEAPDAPVWTSKIPPITTDEDNIFVSDYGLDEFVYDSDGNELEFFAYSDDGNIDVGLNGNNSVIVEPAENFFGESVLNVSVKETSSSGHWLNTTVSVLVKPVNDPPEVRLIYPDNGTTLTGSTATLLWKVEDIDSDPGDFVLDIYLGENTTPERFTADIKGTSRIIEDLRDNTTYHWRIAASDGADEGASEIRKFEVDTSVELPVVGLLTPLDGLFLNRSSADLTWEAPDPGNKPLLYNVFLGRSPMHLELAGFTSNPNFRQTGLKENVTYYWKALPQSNDLQGVCRSGLWEFTYLKNFQPNYRISASLDRDHLDLVRDENASFNLTLNNTGNLPVSVSVQLGGSLAKYVEIERSAVLGSGESRNIRGMFLLNEEVTPGKYNLTIHIDYDLAFREVILPLTVEDEGDVVTLPEESFEVDWFWLILDVLVLVIFLTGLILLIRKRKADKRKKELGQEEVVTHKGGRRYVVGGYGPVSPPDQTGEWGPESVFREGPLGGRGREGTGDLRPPNWLKGASSSDQKGFLPGAPQGKIEKGSEEKKISGISLRPLPSEGTERMEDAEDAEGPKIAPLSEERIRDMFDFGNEEGMMELTAVGGRTMLAEKEGGPDLKGTSKGEACAVARIDDTETRTLVEHGGGTPRAPVKKRGREVFDPTGGGEEGKGKMISRVRIDRERVGGASNGIEEVGWISEGSEDSGYSTISPKMFLTGNDENGEDN